MKKVFVFLAEGFEESEAIVTIDILRRASVDVTTVSVTDSSDVRGAHGISVKADSIIANVNLDNSAALVLPGGMPGTINLEACSELIEALKLQNQRGGIVAAICAAPSILGKLGITSGRTVTCYPGFENYMKGAVCTGSPVEVDGNIITGRGPGAVFNFALSLLSSIVSTSSSSQVYEGLTSIETPNF